MTKKQIIIAGPCAAESHHQVVSCARELKKRGVSLLRASLWKPRTQPGFDGVGQTGISWLSEATQLGMTVSTEVILPKHVSQISKKLRPNGQKPPLMVWLGSRNQNHIIQREIAKTLLKVGPKNSLLLIKNQPWEDERHWLGIVDHVLSSGFPKKRVLLCHRGFTPAGRKNPSSFRNLPNYEMAISVKKKTNLPMLIDPSHIGGSQKNVLKVVKASRSHPFDGIMVEVTPNPKQALTDAIQQLNLNQFDKVLKLIK